MTALAGKWVLFDLDGTLVDPAPGITGAFRAALTEMGEAPPPAKELTWVIGPPLRQSFRSFLGSEDRAETALAAYRRHYKAGAMFDAAPYPGIRDVLESLHAQGARLLVCTAKPEVFAKKIVERFDFSAFFERVYGPDLDGRFEDKGELIAHILAQEGFAPKDAVMIGDRDNDTRAAARNGMASVGVLWGFGGQDELTAGGATRLCGAPADLPMCIAGLLGQSG